MALGHVAEIIGNIIEAVVDWFPDGMLDWLIRKPGYVICRVFSREVNQESNTVFFIGLLFWICVSIGTYFALSG